MKHFELIKVFFDCIGPDDSRLVVQVRDAQKQTMLYHAVMLARFDVVELLLRNGAEPGVRDISGRTAYVSLLAHISLQGTMDSVPLQGMMAVMMKEQLNLDDASRTLSLLEQVGGVACAIDDDVYSKEEVERLLLRFRSSPRIGQVHNPIQIANAQSQIVRYLSSDGPYVKSLASIRDEYLLLYLAQSIGTWADDRAKGLISSSDLPKHWSEFFQEANQEMGGILTSWMKPDQIPQITKLLRDTTISACEWAVKNNAVAILVQISRIIAEMMVTGAAEELEEHVTFLGLALFKVYQEGFKVPWYTRLLVGQRLRKVWKTINRGETLDLVYGLAIMANAEASLERINEYTLALPLRSGAKTPAPALENLSLPKKYPGATVFVTTRTLLIPIARLASSFIQLNVFLFPCVLLFAHLYIKLMGMRYDCSKAVIMMYLWGRLFPSDWILFDANYQLHPNIYRGIRAAKELIVFRFWHRFPLEEPLILSFYSKVPTKVDIPSRLDSMHKNVLYPIYWMSLRAECVMAPVPCYAAMGELMAKWKDGRLPRKAWCVKYWYIHFCPKY